MSIRATPALDPVVTVPIPILSDEAAPSAPVQQEKVVERKKKTVGKKVRWKVKSSKGEDLSQGQDSLDDREVVQSLMEGSILSHIVERFDESFAAFLELGHYLFVHSKTANQRLAEAFRALEEARAEIEKARAEANALKVASETHLSKVERLRKELREQRKEMAKLRAELALKEERRKLLEEVNAAMKRAVQDFESSKDMEDIKLDHPGIFLRRVSDLLGMGRRELS
ncbi:hypothetical protein COCNU_04G015800 [Cocos nucifera]|uniref:Uncharacterized protein n=1 Tax=Cocos nucifera TaxID=13894 RepID=A0A8K0N1H4_COCNU|nr:hypothetical protein COCNU_04G015800 [Cocos nucifera]